MEADSLLQEIIGDDTFFTTNAYEKLCSDQNTNFFVSPFSVETVLTLIRLGAKGQTAEEIRIAFAHLYSTKEKVQSTFKNVLSVLTSEEYYTLKIANKIYVKNSYVIKNEFKKMAIDAFHADVEVVDFANVVEVAQNVNTWVKSRTQNKICDLISTDMISMYTRLILINAIYFKAEWVKPFETHVTCDRAFFKINGEVIQVKTMESTSHYNYYEYFELNARFLELQLKSGASMTIILPNDKDGITEVENRISLAFTVPEYIQEHFTIRLPKFKVESTVDFKDILLRSGVLKAFDEEDADFSDVAGKKGELYINSIVHKTFVDVCEEGVEAAAASALELCVPRCAFISEGPPREFIVDHPFIFYIKIKGVIVFVGRVMDPTSNN